MAHTSEEGALASSRAADVTSRMPDVGAADALLDHPENREAAERRRRDSRRSTDRRVMAVIEGMSDAFLALGPDWRVTYANAAAALLNDTTPGKLVGVDHWERWPHTLGSEVERQYRRAAAERVPVEFEHHYEHADIWHEIRAYPSDDGGLAVFFRDITATKKLEAERERQARELNSAHLKAMAAETQFRLLVAKVRDYAVFLIDPDGIITTWGEGARRIKRFEASDVIGKHLRMLYPYEGAADDGTAEEHLRAAVEQGEYIGEGMRIRKGGDLFPARVVLTALREGGRIVGFSKITQDLSAERERESAIAAAMDAARSASIAKSQFLANTSHEIRTPLNAIMGYAELLELGMGGALTTEQQHYVARIQTTSRHLLGLINDVLDLSRIEAGHMRTTNETALVSDAVSAAIQIVEPQFSARGIVLANACTSGEVAYHGDAERMRQVLVNLLSNAARFTERGGRVTVTSGTTMRTPAELDGRGTPPWTFVRVEDTGLGIPAEHMSRIWDAFEQADASRTRRVGGSGLGLTISRHLARLMGGDITAQSLTGLGSSFVVWLPSADASDVAASTSLASGESSPADKLANAEGLPGLADLSEALLNDTERVIATYTARLRADATVLSAMRLSDTQIEDHMATMIADLAQSLTIIGRDGPELTELMRDGSAIQRLIAARHGEQRGRHGWSEPEIRREFQLLREEVHAALERRLVRGVERDVRHAIDALDVLISRAEETAVAALHAVAQSMPTSSSENVRS